MEANNVFIKSLKERIEYYDLQISLLNDLKNSAKKLLDSEITISSVASNIVESAIVSSKIGSNPENRHGKKKTLITECADIILETAKVKTIKDWIDLISSKSNIRGDFNQAIRKVPGLVKIDYGKNIVKWGYSAWLNDSKTDFKSEYK